MTHFLSFPFLSFPLAVEISNGQVIGHSRNSVFYVIVGSRWARLLLPRLLSPTGLPEPLGLQK